MGVGRSASDDANERAACPMLPSMRVKKDKVALEPKAVVLMYGASSGVVDEPG